MVQLLALVAGGHGLRGTSVFRKQLLHFALDALVFLQRGGSKGTDIVFEFPCAAHAVDAAILRAAARRPRKAAAPVRFGGALLLARRVIVEHRMPFVPRRIVAAGRAPRFGGGDFLQRPRPIVRLAASPRDSVFKAIHRNTSS
jgi:hypothetical protein